MMDDFIEHPESATNHLVLGMNREQRYKARGIDKGKPVPTWI